MLKISRSSHCFPLAQILILIILMSGTWITTIAFSVDQSNQEESIATGHSEDLEVDVDYPSDTHAGAVRAIAFSQLKSDDSQSQSLAGSRSSSSSANRFDEGDSQFGEYDTDEGEGSQQDEEKTKAVLEPTSDDDESGSNSESQYLIEEIYYHYSYDDALSEGDDHDGDGDTLDFTDNDKN